MNSIFIKTVPRISCLAEDLSGERKTENPWKYNYYYEKYNGVIFYIYPELCFEDENIKYPNMSQRVEIHKGLFLPSVRPYFKHSLQNKYTEKLALIGRSYVHCTLYIYWLFSASFRNFHSNVIRGGFRISSRGWQSNLQGLAKISQGVAKKLRATPRYLLSYTPLLIYAHFFWHILDTCYNEIHKIYFFNVRILSFIRKFDSPQGLGGVDTPSNGQGRGLKSPLTSYP